MTEPLTADLLPGIPPAAHVAALIARLLEFHARPLLDEPTEDRMRAKVDAKQAARILATFCSPSGNHGHPYTPTPTEPTP